MITYVNTVLVGTGVGTVASTIAGATDGQYIVVDNNGNALTAATAATAEAIKVGLKSDDKIKWSNIIKKADIKSYHFDSYPADGESEDTVTFDFAKAVTAAADGRVRIVVRLTFKDLPTRFRKWTESYEIVAQKGATAADIVAAFVESINVKNAKRARVIASAGYMSGSTFVTVQNLDKNSDDFDQTEYNKITLLKLVAMAYTDDNSVDSISPANKVRFNGNAWFTMPDAAGFASKNKYTAAEIEKTPGTYYTANWKLVRDAEAQAMGYAGILNRGEGTWPIIKPEMNVIKNGQYDALTLEFENMYRTADDLQRKTKQTLEVFEITNNMAGLKNIIESFLSGVDASQSANASAAAAGIKKATNDIED